ncbi:MAG: hypothetical protein MZV63_08345 [Marinilabiliales bacterium]|nr:hypothetical protein [Marinilabiliales bacterium]
MNDGISKVRNEFGRNSREYCMMMASAGDFVSRTTGDLKQAIEIYDECFLYVENHPWDVSMKKYIHDNVRRDPFKCRNVPGMCWR